MLERRDGPRRQGRQVHPKIGKTEVVPQSASGAVFDQGGEGLRIEGPCLVLRDLCGLNGCAVRHLNNLHIGALARGSKRQAECLEWQSCNNTDTTGGWRLSTLRCNVRGLAVSRCAMGRAYGPLQHLDLDLEKARSGVAYAAKCRS
ncbi:hypothetical protein D3C79_911690 [compost metagenome]